MSTKKKTTRFAGTPSIVCTSSSSLGLPPYRKPPQSAGRIDDLCKILGGKIQKICCLGFLDDQPWQHHIYSARPSLENEARESASFEEILYRGNMGSLAIKQKCTITLTLASAVSQLHDTPWLSESWGMKDIYFINDRKGTSLFDQPYVSKSFAPAPNSQQSTQSKSRCFIKNEMVFALGVALLELSYGKPLLSFKTADDLDGQGNETSFTEFSIANRLIDDIRGRELPNYAEAVIRCIRCNFNTFTYSFDVDEFRECFYQGVIQPLQQDYEYATGSICETS
ncbi:hypothetical protein K440DRAFT_632076 [Wilcoxina mikolae CBS 423.85]|nr:hypothetical protein K440DRAFT_632076 [Wilcoxina mikolae CBS 423.85]